MWAVKNERKYEKNENGSLQRVFPDDHPSVRHGLTSVFEENQCVPYGKGMEPNFFWFLEKKHKNEKQKKKTK